MSTLGVVLICVGCARDDDPTRVKIYAPEIPRLSHVTLDDVDREATRAVPGPGKTGILVLRLKSSGVTKFQALTRAVARRGARRGQPDSIALEVNGRVYAEPLINYLEFPDGIEGSPDIEISALTFKDARRLAREIRD